MSDTVRTDPHALTRHLSKNLGLPLFKASGNQLSLLDDPAHFYETLKCKIRSATKRIVLASLYIGKEETELISTLHAALTANKSLHVTILVDALRSTRESPPAPSCASIIASLHRDFPDRVELRLYRTSKLKPWLERIVGKRFNEGWGLQHMKIYGFDDDVVISGANLSRDYFTNRRDRYLLIENHTVVCDYLYDLVRTVCRFSYRLEADAAVQTTGTTNWKLIWDGGAGISSSQESPNARQTYAEQSWSNEAHRAIYELTQTWKERAAKLAREDKGDTLLLPLLQMGPLGVRQETQAIPQLFKLAQSLSATSQSPARLNLTSGYFSLYKPYKILLSQAQAARNAIISIICAAPEANGFFQSKGVSGWIPEAYTWFEYRFWNALRRRGQLLRQNDKAESLGGVELKEWKKDGWTYHAKGIWFTPPALTDHSHGDKVGPTMVHVGSSNYGARSSDLDLECTFLLSTESANLRHAMCQEIQMLQKDASDIVNEALFHRPERQVRKRVKVAAYFLSGML